MTPDLIDDIFMIAPVILILFYGLLLQRARNLVVNMDDHKD